ncbi:MAG: hypothetical protein COA79_09730 [Planctomycetota bacterium]|nr:MAG: hypothetical protein COA79_09730 [Planctomycetota bacterium]
MKRSLLILLIILITLPAIAGSKKNKKTLLKTKYGTVQILPKKNPWNTNISKFKVHPNSKNFIKSIGANTSIHADFGTTWQGVPNGIPYVIVSSKQKKVPVKFQYADESDIGPYPIPKDAPIEGGSNGKGDRHIIMIDPKRKQLFELFHAFKTDKGWKAGSGAIFDLSSNALRPKGWTSADAAGLPIFPGLVRYEEVVIQKEITHALRFTVKKSQRGYILPATHFASKHKDKNLPPMGLRLRLKKEFDISKFPPTAQVILKALKKYGMYVADNGSDWFISGAPHPKWNDDHLNSLKKVKGNDFEVIYTGEIVTK